MPVSLITVICLSVHLAVSISATPIGSINVKYDIGDFFENLTRKSKFGLYRAIVSGTLHDELALCSKWRVAGAQYVGKRAAQKSVRSKFKGHHVFS